MSIKNFDVLFNPQRIAVIGASENDRAVGYHIFRNMVAKEIGIKTPSMEILNKTYEIPRLREKTGVFRDRRHDRQVLSEMLHEWKDSKALVLAVPSGGMPVAVEVAGALDLPLDVAVVSKILLPWNTEAGFGAVGFDSSVWLNQEYVDYYRLDRQAIEQQTQAAMKKVQRRVKLFRGDRP